MRPFVVMVLTLAGVACDANSDQAPRTPSGPAMVAPTPSGKVVPRAERRPAGEELYRRYCAVCHQEDGRGKDGLTAADLTGDGGPLQKTDEELFRSIRDGVARGPVVMPAHEALLTEEQIREVLAYVRRRFGGPLPAAAVEP